MAKFVKTDDILKDMCGIVESPQKAEIHVDPDNCREFFDIPESRQHVLQR